MAEEINKEQMKTPLLNSFMKAGKVSVFESGLDRPDHIQDRPFFNLLPQGETSFINMSETADKLYVNTPEEQAKSPALNTEAHTFFESMEKRFRTVMPGVTLFIIDPDAVQGRYLMDQEADRSLNKSLYMYVEDKLQKASAGDKKTFLTQDEILKMVSEAGITDRSPFSMRAAVAPTLENLAGLGNVNLVIGDNPDAMSANVLDMVIGAEQRRVKEGISYDEFRRLVLYHELGHATDHNYASAQNSIEKITETELDNVMSSHRTECIADAHAVLQLARDFGTTKCAELWSDCRIEYLRMSVDRRIEDTKYDNDFIAKLRVAEEKSRAINPNDPGYENSFKQLMNDKQVADTIKKLGSPLAYHTTDVIDATVQWAQNHLADGSLQKMTDLEVIKQAQVMSETYGLTRQQMAEMSIALAKGEKHPKYEQMMDRVQVSRDHMPLDKKTLEAEYEMQRELNAYKEAAQLSMGLGLPLPEQNFSPELKKKLIAQEVMVQKMNALAQVSVAQYQAGLFDRLDKTSSREQMHAVLGEQKEMLRTVGKNDHGQKDIFADSKLKVVDAVIEQAPNVETVLLVNKRVKHQISSIKSTTEVSGDDAIAHFIKNELRVATSMSNALIKAFERDTSTMTVQEQVDALRSENKDFKKALIAEKETQIAAFAIRSDKEAWNKIVSEPVLAALVDQKAKQKPTASFAQYQMIAGNPDKETIASMLQDTIAVHKYLIETVTNNKETAAVLEKKDVHAFEGMKKYTETMKKEKRLSPLNLKNFDIAPKTTVLSALLKQKKGQRG